MPDTGPAIVAAAREWIGTPVKWEASLKGKGADCRGLLAGAAREVGRPEAAEIEARVVGYSQRIDEAALLAGLDRLFDRLPEGVELVDGDVLAFRIRSKVQHLAIHVRGQGGEGRMIHAYLTDPACVVEVPLCGFWRNRLAGAWRWRALDGEQLDVG